MLNLKITAILAILGVVIGIALLAVINHQSLYIILLIACALVFAGLWGLLPYRYSKNWVNTTVTIISLEESIKALPLSTMQWMNYHFPCIKYKYEIQGKQYISNRVGFHLNDILVPEINNAGEKISDQDKLWSGWLPGTQIKAFVNPKNPEEAVIIKVPSNTVKSNCHTLIASGLMCFLLWLVFSTYLS